MDTFCVPIHEDSQIIGFHLNTGDEEIDEYFISFETWHTVYGVSKQVTNFRNYTVNNIICYDLDDITELYIKTNMSIVSEYAILRDYCARRLREEIGRIHPDKGLNLYTKSSLN